MPDILPVYIGYDARQALAFNVLQHSIVIRSSKPVSITPLILDQLPIKREGLTPFTYSRFLVPWLQDYKGWALFLDADILLLGDVADLFDLADDKYAVMVSKNPLRFEWASVILWNCGHPANAQITPEWVETANTPHLIDWVSDDLIGDLPPEWNVLVGYDAPREDGKLIHFTQGIPAHPEVKECDYAGEWLRDHQWLNMTLPWKDLMARSVHATTRADGTVIARLAKNQKVPDEISRAE